MNEVDDKLAYIDKVLGFYFDDEPFSELARLFPSPEGQIETWYKFALVFEKVADLGGVPEAQWEILQLFVEDATTEFEAAAMIGEPPDQEQPLGFGYEDSYDIPEGFGERHQALIWQVVKEIYGSYPVDQCFEIVDDGSE